MRYELAIFDMDGTILNTLDDLTDACNYALAQCHYPTRSIEEIRFFVGNGIRRLLEQAVPAGCTSEDVDAVQGVFMPYYKEHSADKTAAYPGVKELLKTLKAAGCKTAVVSNKPDAAVKQLASEYFPGLFDMAIGENEAQGIRRKPASDEVDLVLNALQVHRTRAVYIGDSDVDIATARNSNMDLIAVDWGFRDRAFLQDAGVDTICSRAYEIEKLILTDLSAIKMVHCPSCGAEFEDNRDRCPYCNTMYEMGAERQYMHDLYEMRDDMKGFTGAAVSETANEIKSITGKYVKFLMIILAFVLIIAALVYGFSKHAEKQTRDAMRAAKEWENQNLETWNSLYNEGRYEELCDLYEEERAKPHGAFYSVEYVDFLSVLSSIRSFDYFKECYDHGDRDRDLFEILLYHAFELVISDYTVNNLEPHEYEYVEEDLKRIDKEYHEIFSFTPEEEKGIASEYYEDIAHWDNIEKLIKAHYDELKNS